MADARALQYLVLADGEEPYLLARVRWPDVAQAVTPGCLEWQEDVGLFDLPGDPGSVPVTLERAVDIAGSWGAHHPSEPTVGSGPLLIRRMPANWSNMPPAERHAWSLDMSPARLGARRRRSRAGAETTPGFRLGGAASMAAARRRAGRSNGDTPGKTVAVSPADTQTYEEAWTRVFASVPAVVTEEVTEETADEVAGDVVRLPAVFTRMRGPQSPAVSLFTFPADLGILRRRKRFMAPEVNDGQARETNVFS